LFYIKRNRLFLFLLEAVLSVKDGKKYFYCAPCKFAWETDAFLTSGDVVTSLCPVCDQSASECNHSKFNLVKAWANSTGPKTEAGKARVALNGWKDGAHCSRVRILAPAKFDKFPWCSDCEDREMCSRKEIRYCPRDIETTLKFIQAYKEGDPGALGEEAAIANAKMWNVFNMMIHNIMQKGVMLKVVREDEKGNKSTSYEKNQLVKELPAFISSIGFNADQRVMTPKAVEQKEALEGHLVLEERVQEEAISVRKRAHDELSRLRALMERELGGSGKSDGADGADESKDSD
jgi:hypothetical protein